MPAPHANEQARRRFVVVVATASLVMIPWVAALAWTPPPRYLAGHWRATWVGFDLVLAAALALTALAAVRRRQVVVLTAVVSATLLACDLRVHIMTASRGGTAGSASPPRGPGRAAPRPAGRSTTSDMPGPPQHAPDADPGRRARHRPAAAADAPVRRPAAPPAPPVVTVPAWRPMDPRLRRGRPGRLAAFWAIALGYVVEPGYDDPDGASIIDPDGVGPAIGFLRVPEGKTARTRCTSTSGSPANRHGTWPSGPG